MPNQKISLLRNQLKKLIEGLRDLPTLSEEEALLATKHLKNEYAILHNEFTHVSARQIKTFEPTEQLVIQSFEMGRDSFVKFHSKILSLITDKAKPTALAIANFTKSEDAFDLINKSSAHLNDDEINKLKGLLGGILGVRVGEEFVRSIKGEMMGRVIAYALSGRCEEDLADFAAMNAATRLTTTRDAFLLDQIIKSNAELVYSSEPLPKSKGSNKFALACTINEKSYLEPGAAAPRNHADACVVNHSTRTIVFGSATSNAAANKKQALPAIKMYNALSLLVLEEFVGIDKTQRNPYYGYKVEPFYFHTGLFSFDHVVKNKRAMGSSFFKMLSGADEKLKNSDYSAIAQLSFFSLLGEGSPSAQIGKSLSEFNVHICGCDTLKLYNSMKRARRNKATDPRAFAAVVLEAMKATAEVLGRSGMALSSTAKGQNLLESTLDSLACMAENYFINFPVKKISDLSVVERENLRHLSTSFACIKEKLQEDDSGYGDANLWRRRFDRLSKEFRSLKTLISYTQWDCEPEFVWGAHLQEKLVIREDLGLTSDQSVERITNSILADLSVKTLPPVLKQAMDLAQEADGHFSQKAWVKSLIDQVAKTAQGGRAVCKLAENSSQASFNQSFSTVRSNSDENHPAVTLIVALRPLFDKQVWYDRANLSENRLAVRAVKNMVEKLLFFDSSMKGYESLMQSFSKLANPSASSMALSRQRRIKKG